MNKQNYSVMPYKTEQGKECHYVTEGGHAVLGPYKTYAQAQAKADKLNAR